jgi:alditol oxidase
VITRVTLDVQPAYEVEQRVYERLSWDAVERITAEIEEALAPFHMRPHWGKLFHMNAATVATLYERHGDFVRLQERLDPRGAFRNQWLQSRVLGDS